MFCPYCSASLSDDAKFCKSCGKRIVLPDGVVLDKQMASDSPNGDSGVLVIPSSTDVSATSAAVSASAERAKTSMALERRGYEIALIAIKLAIAAIVTFAPFLRLSVSLIGIYGAFSLPGLAHDFFALGSELQRYSSSDSASIVTLVACAAGAIWLLALVSALYTAFKVLVGDDEKRRVAGIAAIIAGVAAILFVLYLVSSIKSEMGGWVDTGDLLRIVSCTPWVYLTIGLGIADITLTKKL